MEVARRPSNDARFARTLLMLRRYAAREGHAKVPADHVEEGVALGKWVMSRRLQWRAGTLPSHRVDALESVPGWVWNVHEDMFARGVAAVRAYAERENTLRIPGDHVEDGVVLTHWIGARRAEYRRGQLSPERIDALEAVPYWSWRPWALRRAHPPLDG